MSQQFLYVGPLSEAPKHFDWAEPLAAALARPDLADGAATAIKHPEPNAPGAPATWTLALALPERFSDHIVSLAQATLDTQNVFSDDLMRSIMVSTLTASGCCLQIDQRELDCLFPGFKPATLVIGIVCAGRLVVVRHEWGLDGLECFEAGVQGAAMSSGINYRPYRIWSDEELEAAALLGTQPAEVDDMVTECRLFELQLADSSDGANQTGLPAPASYRQMA